MRTGKEVSKKAFELWQNRANITYLYGAKGEIGTEEFVRNMFKRYPDYFKKYSDGVKEQIVKECIGKRLFDCSGFVCYCADIPDVYSGKLLDDCIYTTADYHEGEAGWLAWKPGHVGIDRGDGTFLHMYTELHTIEPCKFCEYNWQKQGKLKGVDYTKAEAEIEEYTVQSGDNLWKIANKYYGNGKEYNKIMEENHLQSDVINVGQKLVIPE